MTTKTADYKGALEALLEKLETGATSNSEAMLTFDAVKSASIEHPEGSLARDIYEPFIDEIADEIRTALLTAEKKDKQIKRLVEALEKIAKRPDLPNPERDADWKNCMKWSSHEAQQALTEHNGQEGKDAI